MHISHLYVRNFRSLSDLSMEFTGGANLIVGPNAVGKTTILEAIRLAKAVLAPRTQQEARQVMIQLSATSAQLPQMFNFGAIAKDASKPIEIRCTFKLTDNELSSLSAVTEDISSRIAAAQAGISMDSGPFALVQFLSSPVGKQIVDSLRPRVLAYTEALKKKPQCELVLIMDPAKGIRGGDIYPQTLLSALENGLPPSRTPSRAEWGLDLTTLRTFPQKIYFILVTSNLYSRFPTSPNWEYARTYSRRLLQLPGRPADSSLHHLTHLCSQNGSSLHRCLH